jgi:hypothetical protein
MAIFSKADAVVQLGLYIKMNPFASTPVFFLRLSAID